MGAPVINETLSPHPLTARFPLRITPRSLHDHPISVPVSPSSVRPRKNHRTSSRNHHHPMAACLHIHNATARIADAPSEPLRGPFVGFRRHPLPRNEPGCDEIWLKMREEALADASREPILAGYYQDAILSHDSLEAALANRLAVKLGVPSIPSATLFVEFRRVLAENWGIINAVKEDLRAALERDPACVGYAHCFLNFKGFLAIQSHRVAHWLWSQRRDVLALLIQNRVSEVFAVDIHPGARIGHGILLDHATGFVVGETAVIGNVSILHNVTLGGTGKASGDRHPKIGDGVLIGAETCILGNIRIGEGAKIGAGSVVLRDVPPRTTAVGNPARLIGGKENPVKLVKMPSFTMDHTSYISEWSDYVI